MEEGLYNFLFLSCHQPCWSEGIHLFSENDKFPRLKHVITINVHSFNIESPIYTMYLVFE